MGQTSSLASNPSTLALSSFVDAGFEWVPPETCTRSILFDPCNPLTAIDLPSTFTLKRMLSGGKSGAYLFAVQHRGHPDTYILKLYPDAYAPSASRSATEMLDVRNERPFRELLTLCKMSGTYGFPRVYQRGCARMPVKWLPAKLRAAATAADVASVAPFVVMSTARGVPLSDLNLTALTSSQAAAIALSLLALLVSARVHMGASFEHFDLHPDNIFVDMTCDPNAPPRPVQAGTREPLQIGCPEVSLIDFDLVRADETFAGLTQFARTLPEQTAKRNAPKAMPVPERTIQFALKWLGPVNAGMVFQSVSSVQNTDMRNWAVIVECLFAGKEGIMQRRTCTDVDECIAKNYDLFAAFIRTSSRSVLGSIFTDAVQMQRKTKLAAQQLVKDMAMRVASSERANATMQMFSSLIGGQDDETVASAFQHAWSQLDAKEMQHTGGHLTYDSVLLLIALGSKTLITVQLLKSVYFTFDNLVCTTSFKQLNPVFKFEFIFDIAGKSVSLVAALLPVFFELIKKPTMEKLKELKTRLIQLIKVRAQAKNQLSGGFLHFLTPELVQSKPPSYWIRVSEAVVRLEPGGLHVRVVFTLNNLLHRVFRAAVALLSPVNVERVQDNTWAVNMFISLSGPPNPCIVAAQNILAVDVSTAAAAERFQPCTDFIQHALDMALKQLCNSTLFYQILQSRDLFATVELASKYGKEMVVNVETLVTGDDLDAMRRKLSELEAVVNENAKTPKLQSSIERLRTLHQEAKDALELFSYARTIYDVNELLQSMRAPEPPENESESVKKDKFSVAEAASEVDAKLTRSINILDRGLKLVDSAESLEMTRAVHSVADKNPIAAMFTNNVIEIQNLVSDMHDREMQRQIGTMLGTSSRGDGLVYTLKKVQMLSKVLKTTTIFRR